MTHGLFIGVLPDPPAAREIAARVPGLKARHGLTGRPLQADRFHVSLVGFGEWLEPPPPDVLADAIAALSEVDFPPFAVQLEFAMSFDNASGRRAFVLVGGEGVIGLEIVHDQLIQTLARLRPRLKLRSRFLPHLTLLYDQRLIPEHPIEPIRWTVREIALVESLRGQSHYIRRGARVLG